MGGAQLGLLDILPELTKSFLPLVAVPRLGSLTDRLDTATGGIPWETWPLGNYGSGRKTAKESLRFAARFPDTVRRLVRLIDESGARLLYVNGPRAFPAAAAAARWQGIPAVWHLQLELDSARDRRICQWAARLSQPTVLACSRVCLNAFSPSSFLRRTARVVYPGIAVPPAVTHKNLQNAAPIVGVVGRIHPDKGQDILLLAAHKVRAAFSGARFRLAGKIHEGDLQSETYARELAALGASLGHDVVEFRGWVDGVAEIADLDVLAVPSRREALCRVIPEAFALRVPVVAAASGGITEVIEHGKNGLLVPPGDPDALAQAILQVLKDPALACSLTEHGYQDYLARWRLDRFATEVREALQAAHAQANLGIARR